MEPRLTKNGNQTLTTPDMREPVGTVLTATKVNLVLENNSFSVEAASLCCQ